ncbi:transcriptional regulator [Pedobacter sp. HMWF019]|nr:transcriptional regulator [Pedobacter sp. HMWF019]
MNRIGLRIRSLRQKIENSQEQIAKKLGISIPAFSKMETGITDINVSRIFQIAELFKVKPSFFFEDDDKGGHIDTDKLELVEQLQQKTSTIVDLQAKLIQCYEEIEEMKKSSK